MNESRTWTTNESIEQISARFPGQTDRISQLWMADEDFRELCRDYALCLEMLTRCAAETALRNRTGQYQRLQQNLEMDILDQIKN